jgi:hypothetical protein
MLFIFLLCIEIFSFVLLKLFPEIRISIIYFVENSIIHHKVADFDEKMKYLLQVCFLIMEITCVTAMLHIWIKNCYLEISNNFIHFLRVVATACVFILHTSIFTNQHGNLFAVPYTYPLRTPAWGGMDFLFAQRILSGKRFCVEKI